VSGHGRSCPGDVTWFVRPTCVIVGGTGGGTLHRPWSDDVPPKMSRLRQDGERLRLKSRARLKRVLAALGLPLQIP
jgi:hypothetical protein